MEVIGKVYQRQVAYISAVGSVWQEALPSVNWVLLAIADKAAQVPANATAVCVRHGPAGIGCVGNYAGALEDSFDMEVVMQALAWEEAYGRAFDYSYAPITTADSAIEEGLWYALTLAPGICEGMIEIVVCLDFTGKCKQRVTELVDLINAGWFPPDLDK